MQYFRFLLTAILFITFTLNSSATNPPESNSIYRPIEKRSVYDIPNPDLPQCVNPQSGFSGTDDPLGPVIPLGTTWYETQFIADGGNQFKIGENGWPQIVWANGLNIGGSLMHIFYQAVDDEDQLLFGPPYWGVQVDACTKAGRCVLDLPEDDRISVAGNGIPLTENEYRAMFFTDYVPFSAAITQWELPPAPSGEYTLNPRMIYGGDNIFHFLTVEPPPDTSMRCDFGDLYYCTGEIDPPPGGINMNFSDLEPVANQVMGYEIAKSPVSERTAIGWLEAYCTGGDNQHDNDLIICISEDGSTWDFTDTLNLTNWRDPMPQYLPDTVTANTDTFRCHPDFELLFDEMGYLHVFYTIRGYYAIQQTITYGNSYIMHWDEEYQVHAPVACGWFENGYYDPGAWNVYVGNPSPVLDESNGDLYCVYRQLLHPLERVQSIPPVFSADTTDFSIQGFPNSELWAAKSEFVTLCYYCLLWDEGINITNTQSPDANAGDCFSEIWPSANDKVVNDSLHLSYIIDRDAGSAVFDESYWTENEVMYHRAPLPEHNPSTRLYPYDIVGVEDFCAEVRPPESFWLEQNYPNPFNATTAISFNLQAASEIDLAVYNISGQRVWGLGSGVWKAGTHEVMWDAEGMASGIYLIKLSTEDGVQMTRKAVLLK